MQDRLINERHYEIAAKTLTMIATQAPMTSDLRLLAAVLEIAGELERMGDYAKGIANITVMLGDQPLIKPLIDIPRFCRGKRKRLDGWRGNRGYGLSFRAFCWITYWRLYEPYPLVDACAVQWAVSGRVVDLPHRVVRWLCLGQFDLSFAVPGRY